jgi:3',5'-cyclic AMP phosphodiesterase CpdA
LSRGPSLLAVLLVLGCGLRDRVPQSVTPSALPARNRELMAADPGFGSDDFRPFSFLLLGDPQLGMDWGGSLTDHRRRFAQAAREANALKPAFVIIPGDLVQKPGAAEQWRAVEEVLGLFKMPVFVVPGNHDVRGPRSRAAWLRRFGADNFAITYRNCEFIFLSSMVFRRCFEAREAQKQVGFLEVKLAGAAELSRRHVFVSLHCPPFVRSEADRDGKYTVPREHRRRILALARRHGVRTFLCGHTHKTEEIRARDGAFAIHTASGTAAVSPASRLKGFRYRIFKVRADRVESLPVLLGAAKR